jgi:hypothetical protein
MWADWKRTWEYIDKRKKKLKAKLYTILLGDLVDKNKHDQLDPISLNRAEILKMGRAVLEPVFARADKTYVLRGTEAHTGEHCELEEELAADLGAEPSGEAGDKASWGSLWAEFGGVTFYARHHPRTGSFRPWTMGPSTSREQEILNIEFLRKGLPLPDVALVAHYHWYDVSGNRLKPRVYRCPAWKLLDGLGHRKGRVNIVEEYGTLLFECREGEYNCQPLLKTLRMQSGPIKVS